MLHSGMQILAFVTVYADVMQSSLHLAFSGLYQHNICSFNTETLTVRDG